MLCLPSLAVSRRHEVIVVGAGLAGLVAARRLGEQGLDVMVVEARDRVGGRLWSHSLSNGEIVELGGEWISTSQQAVMGLAGELGLGLVDTGMDFISRDPVGGDAIPAEEHERLGRLLAERMAEIGAPALSVMSARALLDDLGETGPAMSVLRSRLQGTAGAPLQMMAAAEIGEEFGIGDQGSYVRIESGNDRLAKDLASALEVELQTEVRSIGQEDGGALVVAGDGEIAASAVVVAVPLGVLAHLDFEPALPADVASTISDLAMGTGIKVAMATAEPAPLFRRQDTDTPAWYWTGLGPSGSVREAVTGFAGSEPGVAALRDGALHRLARAAPEVRFSGDLVVADWGADRLAGGCYSLIGPGQRSKLEILGRPIGRLFLAGEHVNGSGTIDGAILSGEAAADLVMGSGVF
jgi:monoamine oxidase